MIFVTLGTHDHPFPRLLDLVSPLAPTNELVIQHGHTPPRGSVRARWIAFTGYGDMLDLMRTAEAIVCHGGVGTIITALTVEKTPVVVPRLRRYGEHVDDHQLQIARELEGSEHVVVCREQDEIATKIADARRAHRRLGARGVELRRAIAEAVASAGVAPRVTAAAGDTERT